MIYINDINYIEITNTLDEKYFDIVLKIYSDLDNSNNRRKEWSFSYSDFGNISLEEACKLGSSYIDYENREKKSFALIKWFNSIKGNDDKITIEPNENVYTFLKENNLNLEELF